MIKVQLVHIQGPLKGQIQEFTKTTITVGRHPSCSVQFPTETSTISRRHAELVRVDNRYKIVDQSTNGTFVNGKKITEAFLKDGDVIMFTEGGPKVSFLASITSEIMPKEQDAPVSPAPEPKPAFHAQTPPPPVSAPEPGPAQSTPARRPVEEEPPKPAQPVRQAVQKVQAPLMVQFGPKLSSFKELPVTIGKGAGSDFVLTHPAIADQHAQIFFSQNQYWVRDLTGRESVTVNGSAIGFEAPLKPQDIISLASGGPALCFMGEGRLAEHEQADELEESIHRQDAPEAGEKKKSEEKKGKSFLRDFFRK